MTAGNSVHKGQKARGNNEWSDTVLEYFNISSKIFPSGLCNVLAGTLVTSFLS